jgi:hypothetical protein
MSEVTEEPKERKRKKSGIPTGNAGEYFVMGELLRRGFDAQLADRNTRDYDILVGKPEDRALRKVQIKSVRSQPWYVTAKNRRDPVAAVIIYVLIGKEDSVKPVRYFITISKELVDEVHYPAGWKEHGFMSLKSVQRFEDKWENILS